MSNSNWEAASTEENNQTKELLILDDTEVRTGEHSMTVNFLPEMVVDIRKSGFPLA